MGVAGLSHIHTQWKNSQRDTNNVYIKALGHQLTNRHGCFMSDSVVLFIALLPWQVWTGSTRKNNEHDARKDFLDSAKRLLVLVDPMISDRSQSIAIRQK